MNISHLAYQFRLDYQIGEIPLEYDRLERILQKNFRILNYSEAADELVQREYFSYTFALKGFSLTDDQGQTTVYISDSISREMRLRVLLYELGHVFCGHCHRLNPVEGSSQLETLQEQQANEFALNVLAPVCYLARLPFLSQEDISRITYVSDKDAALLYQQVIEYRNESHLITGREKKLIKLMKKSSGRPSFHLGRKWARTAIASVCIALTLIAGVSFSSPHFEAERNIPAYLPLAADTPAPKTTDASSRNKGSASPPGNPSKPLPEGASLPPQSETFFATSSGKRYHRSSCQFVRGKENVMELTKEQLDAMGLTPCQTCHPESE